VVADGYKASLQETPNFLTS